MSNQGVAKRFQHSYFFARKIIQGMPFKQFAEQVTTNNLQSQFDREKSGDIFINHIAFEKTTVGNQPSSTEENQINICDTSYKIPELKIKQNSIENLRKKATFQRTEDIMFTLQESPRKLIKPQNIIQGQSQISKAEMQLFERRRQSY